MVRILYAAAVIALLGGSAMMAGEIDRKAGRAPGVGYAVLSALQRG